MRGLSVLFLFLSLASQAQVEQLFDKSYLLRKDYYVLRSGSAKMVIQCDKADVGPAFGYMLFDARESAQTSRKERAFNYAPKNNVMIVDNQKASIALSVQGNYPLKIASSNDKIKKAMLTHPRMKLVDHEKLIKRRNTTGEIADKLKYFGWIDGAPAKVESYSRLMPDATMALPIAMNIVDPKSSLSKNTLKE